MGIVGFHHHIVDTEIVNVADAVHVLKEAPIHMLAKQFTHIELAHVSLSDQAVKGVVTRLFETPAPQPIAMTFYVVLSCL
jgi:hypothetical protein